jgi:hypothetical protein
MVLFQLCTQWVKAQGNEEPDCGEAFKTTAEMDQHQVQVTKPPVAENGA